MKETAWPHPHCLDFPGGRTAAGGDRLLQGHRGSQKSVFTSSCRGQKKGLLSRAFAWRGALVQMGFFYSHCITEAI